MPETRGLQTVVLVWCSLLHANGLDAPIPSFLERQPRIVGGKTVKRDRYEYLAFTAGPKLCGATLIHDDILLTSGHCKVDFDDGIFIGGVELSGSDGDFYDVNYVYVHEGYPGSGAAPHDIALVKLSTPIDGIQPVELATSTDLPSEGSTITVAGWGMTEEEGPLSHPLLETNLDVPDFTLCNNIWGFLLEDVMFCTLAPPGEIADSCGGDSGGPLLDGNGVQVGIVSFGSGCARQNLPSVNTRVGGYHRWIREGVCANSDVPPGYCNELSSTESPTTDPTRSPTVLPTLDPTKAPTSSPTSPSPTRRPTPSPTKAPITRSPTLFPTTKPTRRPTPSPTKDPTRSPTLFPTTKPTRRPTLSPTEAPTRNPTTLFPTTKPTQRLTQSPTKAPATAAPTHNPTKIPTNSPTLSPIEPATTSPTHNPTRIPTTEPTGNPTKTPNKALSPAPISTAPTGSPATRFPTKLPTQPPISSPPTQNPIPILAEEPPTRSPVSLQRVEVEPSWPPTLAPSDKILLTSLSLTPTNPITANIPTAAPITAALEAQETMTVTTDKSTPQSIASCTLSPEGSTSSPFIMRWLLYVICVLRSLFSWLWQ